MLSSSSTIKMRSADMVPAGAHPTIGLAPNAPPKLVHFGDARSAILRPVTRQLAWMTVLLGGGTALAMLLAALAFLPVATWESYVPVATIVGTLGVLLAGIIVERAGERLVRPIRRLGRSIEEEEITEQNLHTLVRHAPAEVAPLLYGLHVTHARLRRTLRQLEQDRAEVGAIFEHMADSVLVLDAHERIVLSNPAADSTLRY